MRNRSKSKGSEPKQDNIEISNETKPLKIITPPKSTKSKDLVFEKCCSQSRYFSFAATIFIISICIVLTAINIHELRRIDADRQDIISELIPLAIQNYTNNVLQQKPIEDDRPVAWIWTNEQQAVTTISPYSSFKHITQVLERLGYKIGTKEPKWDLLWAHDYPFQKLRDEIYDMLPNQRVNHFPGIGNIANKFELARIDSRFTPKVFRLPNEGALFRKYTEKYPDKVWVEKNDGHRGVKIKNISGEHNETNVFLQEYIGRPFLVDGYRFDIGVYTIITSFKPLRVYVYYGDALFRYCPVKYHPFDPANLDKYVVGDDYLPTWEVPVLQKWYVEQGMSMKDSFDAYVRSRNKNPNLIWEQIDEALRTVLLAKAEVISNVIEKGYKSKMSNFYELIRFDFIVDEDLNVHVMEANMSPNLSSAHFRQNELLYEQVLFHALGLVGIGSKLKQPPKRTVAEEQMQVARKNLGVFPEICTSDKCSGRLNCKEEVCNLCGHCLDERQTNILEQAYKEYVGRGECRRIFPRKLKRDEKLSKEFLDTLRKEDRWMIRWFYGKCLLNEDWC